MTICTWRDGCAGRQTVPGSARQVLPTGKRKVLDKCASGLPHCQNVKENACSGRGCSNLICGMERAQETCVKMPATLGPTNASAAASSRLSTASPTGAFSAVLQQHATVPPTPDKPGGASGKQAQDRKHDESKPSTLRASVDQTPAATVPPAKPIVPVPQPATPASPVSPPLAAQPAASQPSTGDGGLFDDGAPRAGDAGRAADPTPGGLLAPLAGGAAFGRTADAIGEAAGEGTAGVPDPPASPGALSKLQTGNIPHPPAGSAAALPPAASETSTAIGAELAAASAKAAQSAIGLNPATSAIPSKATSLEHVPAPRHGQGPTQPIAPAHTAAESVRSAPSASNEEGGQPRQDAKNDSRQSGKDSGTKVESAAVSAPDQKLELPPVALTAKFEPQTMVMVATPSPQTNSSTSEQESSGPASAAVSSSAGTDAAAPAESPALSSIGAARLMQTAAGSELRVGTRSDEFGAVTIHTVLGRGELSAHISLENEHLGSALSTHLSSLQGSLGERLGQSLGVRASVSVSAGPGTEAGQSGRDGARNAAAGGQMSSGTRQGSSSRQQESAPTVWSSNAAPGHDRAARAFPLSNTAAGQGRLDIRI